MFCSKSESSKEFFPVLCLAYSLGGSGLGRLHENRICKFLLHPGSHIVHTFKLGPADTHILSLADADGIHDSLGVELIHGAGRSQHTAAHIRDPGQFKKPLQSSILPVHPVKHREDYIDIHILHMIIPDDAELLLIRIRGNVSAGPAFHPGSVFKMADLINQLPLPIFGDSNHNDVINVCVDAVYDSLGRNQRHLVL